METTTKDKAAIGNQRNQDEFLALGKNRFLNYFLRKNSRLIRSMKNPCKSFVRVSCTASKYQKFVPTEKKIRTAGKKSQF